MFIINTTTATIIIIVAIILHLQMTIIYHSFSLIYLLMWIIFTLWLIVIKLAPGITVFWAYQLDFTARLCNATPPWCESISRKVMNLNWKHKSKRKKYFFSCFSNYAGLETNLVFKIDLNGQKYFEFEHYFKNLVI